MIDLTDEMKQQFVDAHNLARSNVDPPAADMQMVEWDDDIAGIAENFVKKCDFQHSPVTERLLPGYPYGLGENIFVGMSRYHIRPDYITKKWDEERKYYDYEYLTCQPGKMCGHYTQVVWSSTRKIGCAIAKCQRIAHTSFKILDLIAVCHYGPPGNFRGEKPYKAGEACSACPINAGVCEDGFCT